MTSAERINKTQSATVLLVEDNFVNQKVASVLLQRLGLKVKIVSNGEEAVKEVQKNKYDIILMDCHMPIMDGFQATVEIRKLETISESYTPIIAVTALAMGGDRERCIAAGMDDYVAKPIDRDILKAKINHWLKGEVVYQSQKLRRKVLRPFTALTLVDGQPIDMEELEEFYGNEMLVEMMETFLSQTEDMIAKLRIQLFERNARAIAGLAHEVKASCASIGAKQIARLCLYLEQAATQNDWLEVEETLSSIEKNYNNLKSYIQSSLQQESAT